MSNDLIIISRLTILYGKFLLWSLCQPLYSFSFLSAQCGICLYKTQGGIPRIIKYTSQGVSRHFHICHSSFLYLHLVDFFSTSLWLLMRKSLSVTSCFTCSFGFLEGFLSFLQLHYLYTLYYV